MEEGEKSKQIFDKSSGVKMKLTEQILNCKKSTKFAIDSRFLFAFS